MSLNVILILWVTQMSLHIHIMLTNCYFVFQFAANPSTYVCSSYCEYKHNYVNITSYYTFWRLNCYEWIVRYLIIIMMMNCIMYISNNHATSTSCKQVTIHYAEWKVNNDMMYSDIIQCNAIILHTQIKKLSQCIQHSRMHEERCLLVRVPF